GGTAAAPEFYSIENCRGEESSLALSSRRLVSITSFINKVSGYSGYVAVGGHHGSGQVRLPIPSNLVRAKVTMAFDSGKWGKAPNYLVGLDLILIGIACGRSSRDCRKVVTEQSGPE